MTSRDIGDISTNPGGMSGAEWTGRARQSVKELWDVNGGLLIAVSGTNTLSAVVAIAEGFTAYTDGLRCTFVAAQNNTGAVTIDVSAVGAKPIRDPDGDVLAAGAIVAGRITEIIFVADDDSFRLVTSGGTTNVTVVGGLTVQRSAPSRLVEAAGPATAATIVGSMGFQALYANSRVIIEGVVGRVTAGGSADDDGATIALFVDGVQVQAFTDHCQPNSQVNTPFAFSHQPGNTDNHTYSVRASSTIATTYPKGVNAIICTEMSPNG